MLFFEDLAMESMETLVLPHAHLGTVRGAEQTRTQSSFDGACGTWEIATMR